MYWIDDAFILIAVIVAFWLVGLALCVGVPVLICHIFRVHVNLWTVAVISALVWIVGTYIWYNMPI